MSVNANQIQKEEKKNNRRDSFLAFLLTLLITSGVFVLLWFFVIDVQVQEDEGIEVAFGDAEEGEALPASQGFNLPTRSNFEQTQNIFEDDDLLVQEDPSEILKKRDKKQEQEPAKPQEDLEKRRQEEQEARERALEQQRINEQNAIDRANALGSLFANDNAADGVGSIETSGDRQRGNPVGKGSVGGINWSLAGRNIRKLPPPSSNFDQEGRVVVNVQVDSQGKVISASVGSGTTVSGVRTRNIALAAAKSATFTPSNTEIQMGTITYTFKFK